MLAAPPHFCVQARNVWRLGACIQQLPQHGPPTARSHATALPLNRGLEALRFPVGGHFEMH